MAIDWDAIRERGAAGLLTADETDALVELARNGITHNGAPKYCWLSCIWSRDYGWRHDDDCPIHVLEATSAS